MHEMTELEKYYNKFNEEKRLSQRRGIVEFTTSMKYINECINGRQCLKIADIGAGTGRYSFALADMGHDVTAVEPVKYNLGILRSKGDSVRAFQGNALKLKKLADGEFDITLLFGPLYHLFSFEDKVQALKEARRITKQGGYILAAYCMNEYAVLFHGFREGHIKESLEAGKLDCDFHCISHEEDLYDYVRLEDIHALSDAAGLERVKTISADGAAHYMRPGLNAWDEETFKMFMDYHLATCERTELLGAARHTVDILVKR
jgi:SAM-dependent methyltransferase